MRFARVKVRYFLKVDAPKLKNSHKSKKFAFYKIKTANNFFTSRLN